MALVRNLVDGRINSVEYIFAEDGIILDAVGRQLRIASKAEIEIQVRSVFLGRNVWEIIFVTSESYGNVEVNCVF